MFIKYEPGEPWSGWIEVKPLAMSKRQELIKKAQEGGDDFELANRLMFDEGILGEINLSIGDLEIKDLETLLLYEEGSTLAIECALMGVKGIPLVRSPKAKSDSK